MNPVRFMIVFAVLIMLWGCKEKSEQMESAKPAEFEVADSVDAPMTEAAIPAKETQTSQTKVQPFENKETPKSAEPETEKTESYKVTFMEIGSESCIPCKMMQPIMKEIADDYKGIVKVEFYDLMKDREIGPRYNIRVMPTQVILNANGKEFFRHEGFYPKAELAQMLDAYLAKLPK